MKEEERRTRKRRGNFGNLKIFNKIKNTYLVIYAIMKKVMTHI